MKCLFALALFCSLVRVIGTGDEMKQVKGILGKNVSLVSGISADLHGREVVWEFTNNSGTELTILDVGPNHPEVKPNKYFEDRLHFNRSTGDLLLSNLKTSDQGSYTISVDGQGLRIIDLRIFDKMKQVNGVVGENVSLVSGNSADLQGCEVVWEFTNNSGTEFTILDVGPNHPKVKPNKYFEDRLHFNRSTGDLLLSNLRTSDQGIYTISVDGQGLRIIDLRIFDERKQVNGVLGKNVSLVSGNGADLRGREVVCEFTSNNGTEFTILAVGPNHRKVKPNKYFEDRLHFNLSTGDLLLSNLRTSDQGIYTISVDGQGRRIIDLRIFGHSTDDTVMTVLSISALVFSSLYLIAFFSLNIWKIKSNRESPKCKWWTRVLYACNILQFVFILTACSYTTHFKGSDFLNAATACITVLLFFTLALPFITRRSNCQRIGRFNINTAFIWNLIQCALHIIMIGSLITFLIKDIHQKNQGRISHIWIVLIASAAECTVSFFLALMFNSSLHSRICLWIRREYSRMTGRSKNINEKGPQNAEELQVFRTCHTEAAGSLHPD
ncbi:uncharacterized protein [Hemitrygon akajei]|uniref:uncharacterized protein n=1 Tax=Hemitrygon akajei TaxID=2704970 RepID=UPI003BF9D34E